MTHILQQIICWLALALGVEHPQRWRSWLLRLVLRPAGRQPPASYSWQQMPDPVAWLAQQLQVPAGASWRMWALRLLILPPRSQQNRRPSVLRALLLRCGQRVAGLLQSTCLALWRLLAWPLRKLTAVLASVGRHLDRNKHRILQSRHSLLPLPVPAQASRRNAVLRWLVLLTGMAFLLLVVSTPLSIFSQIAFLFTIWCLSIILMHIKGRLAALCLNTFSLISMARYAWWRMHHTLDFETAIEALLGYGLLAAEAYTWLIVIFGFIQTAWPLQRPPAPLSGPRDTWPSVDVFIPTYNEPLDVVRPTVLAAMAMDWPADKLNVYILDDGRRDSFRQLARELGIGYITRSDNRHAKAGNLNHALTMTHGDLIAIFDCDHIPVRSFLTTTCGWFQKDPLCALVQTPHHFFSPDPFERNLGIFRRVPNEGQLFHGLVQDGNDFWNAAFFCGSCAVLRRGPLEEIGGIAVETVTEDAHTALKLHRRGYHTAYINQVLAAGLATESLSAHIGQRIRWARGMAQIFRIDNPFLGKGLTVWQRICYSNAMLHFFFGLPRLIFLTAPLAYLLFGLNIIATASLALLFYLIPYIVQTGIANAHTQGRYRHIFWAEVYETVLAWYLWIPTLTALISPRLGKFNVTAKGGIVTHNFFDWKIALPYTILTLLNAVAFVVGIIKCFTQPGHQYVALILNLIWTGYSMLILGAAIAVAYESRQVRQAHRVPARIPVVWHHEDGSTAHAHCLDFSMQGLGLQLAPGVAAPEPGSRLRIGMRSNGRESIFQAEVMACYGHDRLGLRLLPMTLPQQLDYVQCTFARPETWKSWRNSYAPNHTGQSMRQLIATSVKGYRNICTFVVEHLLALLKKARHAPSEHP